MKKTAFLFPGQGSQKVGMGQDLLNAHDVAQEIFSMAEAASGLPIKQLCFQGPMQELTQTVNLQPAVTAVNLAFWSVLQRAGIQPVVCGGHSLGEFSALCAAGVLSIEDCIKVVHQRGVLMHREASQNTGAMSAVIGLNIQQVNDIVHAATSVGVVAVANHNSAEQIVITGSPQGVEQASNMAADQGGRAIPLKVSGAWHSPLIKGAEAEFTAFLEEIPFQVPQLDVLHNVTAETESDPTRIRSLMARQLCSPVRWFDSIQRMMRDQVEVYVEIGPGRVLTGLLKKILPKDAGAEIFNIFDLKSLDKFLTAQG